MECIIIIEFWSSYKIMWTRSSKDISLQYIANHLLDASTDSKEVTESHILVANAPAQIEVLIEQSAKIIANESKAR